MADSLDSSFHWVSSLIQRIFIMHEDLNSSSNIHRKSMMEKPFGVPAWGIPVLEEAEVKAKWGNEEEVTLRALLFVMS